jgi:hypothetical protein
MRRVFQLFEGIDLLIISTASQVVAQQVLILLPSTKKSWLCSDRP